MYQEQKKCEFYSIFHVWYNSIAPSHCLVISQSTKSPFSETNKYNSVKLYGFPSAGKK